MIKTIIQQEQQRLARKGFDYEIQTLSVPVYSTLQQLYLGNDIYILTGIRLSDEDSLMNRNTISLYSPNEQLCLTQQRMAQLGTSIVKVFRQRINIVSFSNNSDIVQYNMDEDKEENIRTLVNNILNNKVIVHEYVRWFVYHDTYRGTYRRIYPTSDTLSIAQYTAIRNFDSYEDYLADCEQNETTPLFDETQWNQRKEEDKKGAWVYTTQYKKRDLSSLTEREQSLLLDYMKRAAGELTEKEIAPYQLEFVRITPIQKHK